MGDSEVQQEIEAAFLRIPPNESEVALIRALLENPGLRSEDLAAIMGWKGGWHLKFGELCNRRAELLPSAPTTNARKDKDGQPAKFWSGILADLDGENRFTMKPAAVRAFKAIGF